ncbi:cysteate racemase [Solicola gregarius]|uniref:Amino acid racemase n=1 Tax=Solicola gregarius TaxID=2908642 RepID=A0AA46YMD0_9ACTN|nr:amino acid racemase [Solicola gregarius]UYM05653.1 amino acid racemase [Solicola gregarius]
MSNDVRPSRVVGILGGMGPAATVDFYDKLVRATPARSDHEHLRVVIWSDPTVPNRHEAVRGTGEDPTPSLEYGIAQLLQAGAEIIVAPCNTVHAFLPALLVDKDVEFLSIIDTAVDAVVQTDRGHRIGILAADGAIECELYQTALRTAGKEAVVLSDTSQRRLMETIFRLKAGPPEESDVRSLTAALDELERSGVTTAVVGCTELTLLIGSVQTRLQLVDASQALARRTVERAH